LGCRAALGVALARPDVPVFLPAAVGHLGLRHPFRGEADNHRAAESLLGADHGAVRPVGPDMADAIPEDLRGRTDEVAGKSAAREPRLADAGPEHPDPAWVLFPERLAWSVLEKHLAQPHAAEARCKRDAGLSAA
jgi:hypothetical protein